MGSSKELFIRMSEEEYFRIPSEIRTAHLSSKITSEEKGDWAENMKDTDFALLYKGVKTAKSYLSEREYQLREERRKINK